MDYSDMTVLIVDDDINFRFFLKKTMQLNFKVNIVEAGNPQVAFNYLNYNMPSMIILDLEMPVMDGFTALKTIRNNQLTKDIPVIICSALSEKELILKLSEHRISDYIIKTSTIEVITEKIKKVLDSILKANLKNPE